MWLRILHAIGLTNLTEDQVSSYYDHHRDSTAGTSAFNEAGAAFSRCATYALTAIDDVVPVLAKSFRARQLVPFVGAGISVDAPSRLPLWDDFVRNVLEQICKRIPPQLSLLSSDEWMRDLPRIPEVASKGVEEDPAPRSLRPELLMEFVFDHLGVNSFEAIRWMGTRPFNANHFMFAWLARGSGRFITTNFDTCVEDALANQTGITPRILTSADPNPPAAPRTSILKIHGSIEDPFSMVFTIRQAAHVLAPWIVAALEEMVRGRDILFVGYSGNDDDILPVLHDLVDKNVCKRVFIVFRDRSAAGGDRIRELVLAHPDRVTATECHALEFTKLLRMACAKGSFGGSSAELDSKKLAALVKQAKLTPKDPRGRSSRPLFEFKHKEPSEKHLAVLADVRSHLGQRRFVVDGIRWEKVKDHRLRSIHVNCLMRLGSTTAPDRLKLSCELSR